MKVHGKQISVQTLMNVSGVCFGTSGMRGLVSNMSSEVCFVYTTAFLRTLSVTSGSVALAMDLRPSSPKIAEACAAAIQHAGLKVEFCGTIPTPALAGYAQAQGWPAIMITGSHIPFDRNGIKFYGFSGEISKADELAIGLAEVIIPRDGLTIKLPSVNKSAYQHYINRYLQFFAPRSLAGLKLGFYEHSSVARDLLKELLQELGAEVISLGRTDAFVPIDTEAVTEADIQKAKRWAEEFGFDAILSTDGDADRPLLGDENGHWFRGDIAGILCAQYLAAQAVVTTVSCNTALELSSSFTKTIRTRIGSPYVIEAIEKLICLGAKDVVGFEPNGGFLVGTQISRNGRILPPLLTRDAVLPILCLLLMARENSNKVSALLQKLPTRFTASDRLQNVPLEASRSMLQEFSVSPSSAIKLLLGDSYGEPIGLDKTDGLRIMLEGNVIVHLRPSGNAPELRCYAESDSQESAWCVVKTCLSQIRSKLDSNLII
ncbi:MAG: phosphomannomutase [Betaproteobacteria bacterium]